jgi:hypothetical protein
MESSLAFKARLVHAEPGQRVVQVSAWRGSSCLGSCLGEADNAEAAEQRALSHLQQRLGNQAALGTQSATDAAPPVRHPVIRTTADAAPAAVSEPVAVTEPVAEPTAIAAPVAEPSQDPEDWSEELAELDVQLKRLNWDRNQEGSYLQRAFGHPSRNRLTAYADLVSYLRSLRLLSAGADPHSAPVPLRRRDLLQQSDQLLQSLQWDAQRGRQLLEAQFQLSSRQQLNDEQLLQFNMLLEEALMQNNAAS